VGGGLDSLREGGGGWGLVWRAQIVLATADGHGTNAIMQQTGKSKPCVWRWQERYVEEGIDGLL
jgi:transposase